MIKKRECRDIKEVSCIEKGVLVCLFIYCKNIGNSFSNVIFFFVFIFSGI